MKKNDRRRPELLSLPMQVWMAVFLGLALLYVVGLSLLRSEGDLNVSAQLTGENYARLLTGKYAQVLWLSVRLAAQTTLISLALGYPFAYIMTRLGPRARLWVLLLVIAPSWTNALIRIYGWKILLYANGPINSFLQALGIIDRPLKLLYTEGAVLLGMVYAMLPFVILPVYTGIERMDWKRVEAARDLGASPLRAFLTVTLPMTLPSLLAAFTIQYDPAQESQFQAAAAVLLSTLLSAFTIPLWAWVLGVYFP